MLKKALATAFVAASIVGVTAPAFANELCYDLQVVVNGETLVAETGCQPIGG